MFNNIFQALAKYHAASCMLKAKNPEMFSELVAPLIETQYPTDGPGHMTNHLKGNLQRALKAVEQLEHINKEKWSESIKFLSTYEPVAQEIQKTLVRPRGHRCDVISHGDVWKNNFLYKNGSDDDNTNYEIKLIDFQAIRHISPAQDIMYFIYTSAQIKVFKNNFEELLQYYFETLQNILRKNEIDGYFKECLTLDWLKKEVQDYAFHGFTMAIGTVQASYPEYEWLRVPGDEKLHPEHARNLQYNRILHILVHFLENFTKNGRWNSELVINY